MNDYTLLIIDMQSQYPAAMKPETINEVVKEVVKAKENGCGIIVVEFRDEPQYRTKSSPYKPTHSEIMANIGPYERAHVVEKYETDGSFFIRQFLLNEKAAWDFNIDNFRVCGVNTDVCVAATVNGLAEDFMDSKFFIVEKACNTDQFLTFCKYGPMFENGKYMSYKAFNPEADIRLV